MIRVSPDATNGPLEVLVDSSGGGGGGGAVTIADGADTVEGSLADAAVVTDAAGTLSGKLRGLVKWAFERMPASLGQKLMASSFPVVIASNQSVIPVDATGSSVLAVVTGTVSVDNFPATQPVSGPLTDAQLRAVAVPVSGTFFQATQPVSAAALPLPTGAATLAGQTQPGVDIGDVTVNNGAAGAAVNIQDGGNTITVDAASLPLPTGAATEATLLSQKVALSVTALQVTASGDTTLVASGTRKLKRIEASNVHATTALVAGLKIASVNSGAVFGKKYLPAAGGLAVWTFIGDYIQVTSEVIAANLSAAGTVEFTAYYE